MVNLTIDGRPIQAEKGKTILEVAKENGIFIPYLCYHPALKPIGACRICVVEVKPGPPRPLPACATYVAEGQEIVTNSERVLAIRQELAKLVLINHALDCPICDKGGECELQDLIHALGVGEVDYEAVKLPPNIDYVSRLIERHPDRCVTCGRCVRLCRDHVGAMAINFMNRGYFTELGSGLLPLDCEFCGSCVDICPVGALINKVFKYRARAWEVTKTETVCPFCGGGCTYQVHTKNGRIVRVVNEDTVLLCGRGRFGFPVLESEDRVRTPLIKENGNFREATWDEALAYTATRLKEILDEAGPGALYGVGSPRATNEANYLFQKFFRAGLGTNNLDNPGRLHYLKAVSALAQVFGWPELTGVSGPSAKAPAFNSPYQVGDGAQGRGFTFALGTLAELPKADLALLIGTDITPELPPLGWALMEARQRDTFKLINANPRQTKFDRYADLTLHYKPGAERLLLAGLLKAMLQARPDLAPTITAQGFEDFKETLKKDSLKEYAKKAGVEEGHLKEAAALLLSAQAPALIFGTEVLGQDKGEQTALALADLYLLIGRPGTPGSKLYPVAEKANTRGVCEVGVLPDRLPGYLPLSADQAPAFFGGKPVAPAGPTLLEMLDLLEAGDAAAPQALYALGGDLLRFLPNRNRVEKLLRKLRFIVVQDAFLTETAKLADVVLPVAVHAEQEGTYLSSGGRLGRLQQALSPNGVRPDWQIIMDLSNRLGFRMTYRSPAHIFQELAGNLPLWAGLAPGLALPCPAVGVNLTGKFEPFDQDISLPGRRPFTLIIGKSLQHSGSFTTHEPGGTLQVTPQGYIALSSEDATALDLKEGDLVRITSSQGEVTAPVKFSLDLPAGLAFMPEHFAEPAAHRLTLNSNLVRVTIQKA
jgi:predicted molibdopterin-dependent oxidoreductase YjgC|uniref:2Fe-2S iron-sulfur cluster binding domain-containing protein n=1 Tax=Desulfobacca acetoxidans TaxID=60893 RepID=A0A7C5EPH7_9BACT